MAYSYTTGYTHDFGAGSQDIGGRYMTKDYLMDVYPSLGPTNKMPGLWSWGYNSYGQLGLSLPTATALSSPTQVGTMTNWKTIVCGQFTIGAIKADGSLWTWGYNANQQLGLGDAIHRSSPCQVGSLTNWRSVRNTNSTCLMINNNNELWVIGSNPSGALGLGDTVGRSSPCQVGSLTNWSMVTGHNANLMAIKTNGTLWASGNNASFGQLGLNDIISRSSPTQVGSMTNWKYISSGFQDCFAIKTDGTLWAWGSNSDGRLGLGDLIHRSSPCQVGSLTNWKTVSGSISGVVTAAIKTDGTLWTWGYNFVGGLGLNNIISRSSPCQVGSLTNWKQVSCAYGFAAIKTDGTLWTCGYNGDGELGLGDALHRSSPCQVGSLTNWKNVQDTNAIKEYEDF